MEEMEKQQMSDWEEAVQNLFRTHPRSISSKTVIEAINSARKSPTVLTLTPRDLASEQNRSWNLGHERGVADAEQRIVERLEAMRESQIRWCGATDCIECEQTIGIEKAIALIKGEQK